MAPKYTLYRDGSAEYLELHALRAPVGNYLPELTDGQYDMLVMQAVQDFELENDVDIFQLGRSGRHICIKDTPANRKRYASLQRKAIAAAKAFWASVRTTEAK